MKPSDIPEPASDEVLVVYSGSGGIPYIEIVTRDRALATSTYNSVVVRDGQHLTPSEATEWMRENPHHEREIEEIDGRLFLAHTSDFDVYLEVARIA